MQSGRTMLMMAMVGWFGSVAEDARADRWQETAPQRLLAKETRKKGADEEGEEQAKKERKSERADKKKREAQEKDKDGDGEKKTSKEKQSIREIVGVLAFGAAPGGMPLVTLAGRDGRTYALDLPEEDLPKARELVGRKVRVRGRVRDRNGEFLIDQIESCRPLPEGAKEGKARPAEAKGDAAAPAAEE